MQLTRHKEILQEYWGYTSFRGIQEDIITSICNKKDTLGLMPTGGGKSITFQVPALLMEGTCIVITPLIALMKDQVQNLRKKSITAVAIHSGMSRQEVISTLDNCILGDIKLLYVSPERLSSDFFKKKLQHIKVSFITVDEAHCISQWGYDFRPSYLNIAEIRQLIPNTPILALTATAPPLVIKDIQQQLYFKEENVFKMSFERKNLAYIVRETNGKEEELMHILNSVSGSAVVYVRSRLRAKEVSELLNENGIHSTFYHAGLEHSVKDKHQAAWQNSEVRVMVATNAFGMGIDKSDVRLVIHIDCPDSIEAYFQEAGRAGRDGNKAWAVLLYNDSDERKLNKRIATSFPEKDYIKQVYAHLAYFFQVAYGTGRGRTFAFDIDKFCRVFKHFPVQLQSALTILIRAGYIQFEHEPDASSRTIFLLQRNDLYLLQGLSPKEDLVITTLLRLYGGLFIDYVYIDEDLISERSGLTRKEIYLLLKGLSQRHILHYIPQKKMPYITFLCERADPNRLIISPEVYERRKEQFSLRIKSVITYAKYHDVCRSRQLLRYFGEERSHDCKQCDVCLEHSEDPNFKTSVDKAITAIKELLSDDKEHIITDLYKINIPERYLFEALTYLSNEEWLTSIDGYIKKND